MHALVPAAIIPLFLWGAMVHAEDRGTWFKNLKQNITGASCCDLSDCRRADAKWLHTKGPAMAGMTPPVPQPEWQWWADVQGIWTPIPPEKVLKKESIDGEAYVCSGYDRRIYCFVAPTVIF